MHSNNGLFYDNKRYFIKTENTSVIFAGDSKKFETDLTKVKNSVKLKLDYFADKYCQKSISISISISMMMIYVYFTFQCGREQNQESKTIHKEHY